MRFDISLQTELIDGTFSQFTPRLNNSMTASAKWKNPARAMRERPALKSPTLNEIIKSVQGNNSFQPIPEQPRKIMPRKINPRIIATGRVEVLIKSLMGYTIRDTPKRRINVPDIVTDFVAMTSLRESPSTKWKYIRGKQESMQPWRTIPSHPLIFFIQSTNLSPIFSVLSNRHKSCNSAKTRLVNKKFWIKLGQSFTNHFFFNYLVVWLRESTTCHLFLEQPSMCDLKILIVRWSA